MSESPEICPMSGKFHSPVIVSRCGNGPTAEELNICGICGLTISKIRNIWIELTSEQEYVIRGN